MEAMAVVYALVGAAALGGEMRVGRHDGTRAAVDGAAVKEPCQRRGRARIAGPVEIPDEELLVGGASDPIAPGGMRRPLDVDGFPSSHVCQEARRSERILEVDDKETFARSQNYVAIRRADGH